MGGACSTQGEMRNAGDHAKDLGVAGKLILEWISGKQDAQVVNRILLAQDTDKWLALVNTVMNLRVP
jgi:hypothetical protein